MRRSNKVIISCAVTGSIHTPSMSPYLPITPSQIAADGIAAAQAGAAILHLHARDPDTGKPDQNPDLFKQFLPEIKQNTNAVLNVTTGGGLGMSMEQRLAAALWARPELASLNMGSLNFDISAGAEKIVSFKHGWERPYLEMTKDFILSNTFTQIEHGVSAMAANGTRFEFECYDVGHLYNLAHFLDRKLVTPPLFVQCIFGVLGGLGADPENLSFMKAHRGPSCSAMTTISRCSQPAGASFRLSLWERCWAAMSVLVWKIICISRGEGWRSPMRNRWQKSVTYWRN